MRRCFFWFFVIMIFLMTSGCLEEMKYTPRSAEFSAFYPLDGTTGIEPFISLYWTCEFAEYYHLYFGTSPDSMMLINDNITLSEYVINSLYLAATYYWQVVAFNGDDVAEWGPVLNFSTRNANWGEFFPEQGAIGMGLEITFTWGMSRADDPRVIYYDFYLGTAADSLHQIAQDILEQYVLISDLLYGTEYFWQVRARNDLKELTPAAVRSFITRQPVWQPLNPIDGSSSQEVDITLSWEIDPAQTSIKKILGQQNQSSRDTEFVYSVYLGSQPEELHEIATELYESHYELEDLLYRNTYYWQVMALYKSQQVLWSEVYNFETKDRFHSFSPGDYEMYIPVNPLLNWNCLDGLSYNLYLGRADEQMNLIASDLADTSYTLYGLDYETIYSWQIEAVLNDGSYWLSPIMNFITIINPIPPGYVLNSNLIQAEMPCNIDVIYQVKDRGGELILGLAADDFEFLEDGEQIDQLESQLCIRYGDELNSTFQTVLMIDNSVSMSEYLDDIKLACYDFINLLQPNQVMSVYAFSEQVDMLEDFTNNQGRLIGAVSSINSGFSSTNLYGAAIEGLQRLADSYLPDEIITGNVILITDGRDTQGSSSLADALEARENKLIYTIGIGSDIDYEALNALGNGDFYHLNSAAEAEAAFFDIQQAGLDVLASIYWLHYITPKRGDVDHTIEISIHDNPFSGNGSRILGQFNSSGFYGLIPGVYINIDPENGLPYGIEEYTISDSASHVLKADTYLPSHEPQYLWQIANPQLAEILLVNENGKMVVIRANEASGITELMVTDTINGVVRVIDLIIE
jgi:hypothetical protein